MTAFFVYLFVYGFIAAIIGVGIMAAIGVVAGAFALTAHTIEKS